jgi:hypothetical protein
MDRNPTTRSLAWFWDQFRRQMLNLDPPYQRRSVWNMSYKRYFIDTVLNNCPAIFLYENITPEGVATYSVVDGKQRLTTCFEFASDDFDLGDAPTIPNLRNLYFRDLDDTFKKLFWSYIFSVEFIPTEDASVINAIFDRINRNVSKLSFQELRHAKFSGQFAEEVERLTEWAEATLPSFPNIAAQSRRQMKDSEFVAQLLLFMEKGVASLSQDALDEAYSEREESWPNRVRAVNDFQRNIKEIAAIVSSAKDQPLSRTRLRNQADFYSFFAAVHELLSDGKKIKPRSAHSNVLNFFAIVDDANARALTETAQQYFNAARSASNDASQRRKRIDIIRRLLQ